MKSIIDNYLSFTLVFVVTLALLLVPMLTNNSNSAILILFGGSLCVFIILSILIKFRQDFYNNLKRLKNDQRKRNARKMFKALGLLFSLMLTLYIGFYTFFGHILQQDKNFKAMIPFLNIDYALEELSDSNPRLTIKEKSYKSNLKNYNFLLLLDHTSSTNITEKSNPDLKEFQSSITPLKEELAEEIDSKNFKQLAEKVDFKSLMTMFILDNLRNNFSDLNANFVLASIKDNFTILSEDKNTKCTDGWVALNDNSIKTAMSLVETYKSEGNDETDFKKTLGSMRHCLLESKDGKVKNHFDHNSKLFIIIISDFYHDDEAGYLKQVESEVKKLAEFKHTSELAMIWLPPKFSNHQRSEDLIGIFNKYFKFIPNSQEKLLHTVFFKKEKEFADELKSLVSPTLDLDQKPKIEFQYSDHAEDLFSEVKFMNSSGETENKPNLVLKLKTNDEDILKKMRIEYKKKGDLNYRQLYPNLSEKIQDFKASNTLKFRIRQLPKYEIPEFGIELYRTTNGHKYLLPATFKEKLPDYAALLLLLSSSFLWISLIVLCALFLLVVNPIKVKKTEEIVHDNPELDTLDREPITSSS